MAISGRPFKQIAGLFFVTFFVFACSNSDRNTSTLSPTPKDTGGAGSKSRGRRTENGPTAPEGMGFLKPDSPGVPDGVKRAAGSVFTIAVPAGKPIRARELFKEGLSLEQVLSKLKSEPESATFNSKHRAVYMHQVNECIRRNVDDCQLFDGVSLGTAFVTGDGRDLRTALHVIEDFARQARAQRQSGRIPIFLFNSSGRLVFGPHNLTAEVAATFDGALDSSVYEGNGTFNLDQVLIRLSSRIANPIPIATRPLNDGEPAYIASVPRRTEDRAQFHAVDADGLSVRVSRGTVIGPSRLVERLKQSGLSTDVETTTRGLREGTALTADGAPQSSGGAILNSHGEVVGVYTAGLPQSGDAFPFRVSYGGNALILAR